MLSGVHFKASLVVLGPHSLTGLISQNLETVWTLSWFDQNMLDLTVYLTVRVRLFKASLA